MSWSPSSSGQTDNSSSDLSAHAQLIVSIHCDVSHPRQRLIPRLLDDLQVAHLYETKNYKYEGMIIIKIHTYIHTYVIKSLM